MITIIRKELADYFTSIRIFILVLLVLLISVVTLYIAYAGIRGIEPGTGFVFLRLFTTAPAEVPFAFLFTFVNFIALFFIPIIGIALGFDAINSERSSGTLSRILSQPVYRDNVINAKFLAGIVTLSIMMAVTILIVSGFGLRMIGVPPSAEEIIRLFLYLVLTIVYGAFWMGLAILFSVLFRRIATSLLLSIFIWLFLGFGLLFVALFVFEDPETSLILLRFSPNWLFGEAGTVLLQPLPVGSMSWIIGLAVTGQGAWVLPNPLSLGQSMLLVWPQLTSLISLTVVCFAISYVLFMRQEIRPT